MNTKDKAKELVDFFIPFMDMDASWAVTENAKLCAIIACERVLDTLEVPGEGYERLSKVKQEIEKI